jgi:hypothetical protein
MDDVQNYNTFINMPSSETCIKNKFAYKCKTSSEKYTETLIETIVKDRHKML